MFRCSRKFSAGTTQKVVLHLLWIFQKLFVDGTRFSTAKLCDWLKPSLNYTNQSKLKTKQIMTYLQFFPALCTGYTYWLWNLIGSFDFLSQYGLLWVYTSANANCTVANYWGHATTVFGKIFLKKATFSRWLFHSIIQPLTGCSINRLTVLQT